MLIQSIKKEAIIILNDLHSVAVLLVLPITFMVIMTFAMGEKQANLVKKINVSVLAEQSDYSLQSLVSYLKTSGFKVNQEESIDAFISIESGFERNLLLKDSDAQILLSYSNELSPQTRLMIAELVKVSISKMKLHAYMEEVGDFDESLSMAEKVDIVNESSSVDYLLNEQNQDQVFSAPTLYSIPSWLIFGIYFIVLPISTTLIKEKENGTLIRIQTYPISNQQYLFTKALSYSAVSVIQWLLLSLVGLAFVPWLTEQALLVINSPSLYLLSGAFIIASAIGFALLIAALVNTYEQAIVLGGGINILMAALSGFMVPIDMMPDALANIANFSPMYWSADILKQGLAGDSFMQAVPNMIKLSVFGLGCYLLALNLFIKKTNKLSWA